MDRPPILLDVMQTLVYEPFLDVMPAFFGMGPDEFLAAKHPTAWIEFEEGTISETEYFERLFSDGRMIDAPGLRESMQKAYKWIDGMEGLLSELKTARYEMHALSNYPIWYRLIDQSLNVSRYVAWTFVSCRTGIRKPDPAAYLGAASTLEIPPSACLFIDDRRENVAAAQSVGMKAIQFSGASELRRELVNLGLS